MPLRTLTAWDGHWVLEVDDHLIMDGQDLGQARDYDAAYGFALVHDQPFYFFEQNGLVHISYGGQTLPNRYDNVFHNQCCEAAIHNVERHGDAVLFHALRDGAWYFVEAGEYGSMPPPPTPGGRPHSVTAPVGLPAGRAAHSPTAAARSRRR